MKILPILIWLLLCVSVLGPGLRPDSQAEQSPTAVPGATTRLCLDMVYNNPGEKPVASSFNNPEKLSTWGYNGQVVDNDAEAVATFDTISADLLPAGSAERVWANDKTQTIESQIYAAHQAGIKSYAWMQALVFPKAVVERFKDEICDAQGHIDIDRPRTQELFRAQLREIFKRLPDLDGLVVRTGEIYLQDLPYHQASASTGKLIQGSTAILHGPKSHIQILQILRDQVCVQQHRMVIYRTWDFGNHFHINPEYYLQVTNAIQPHTNLVFSIKHQAGDFHQLTPFNPTIGIGLHQQIIEVQCQREGYGKGAYPYYIGQGVIDGWEEYAWMMNADQPKGLHDISSNRLIAGVWTWSRGGGWDGPYIKNEFWCALNAYVVSQYAQNPSRTEPEIFEKYAHRIGLTGEDVVRFRQLCLLSERAVLRGQLTTLGAKIDVWWARDDTLSAPDLSDFIKKNLVSSALAEKQSAVEMWQQIEDLSKQIHFADAATKDFVVTSCMYGRLKYSVIAQAWTVMLYGEMGDATGNYDRQKIAAAIRQYDVLWAQWKKLKATHASCSTLPKDLARDNKPGMGAAVNRYRNILKIPTTTPATQKSATGKAG